MTYRASVGTIRSLLRPSVLKTALLATAASFLAVSGAQAQPPIDFAWNNFVSAGTTWTAANNWVPAGPPTSSIDRVLGFSSNSLQTVVGYTSTNNAGAFNVNSLVFTTDSNSTGGVTVTNLAATDTVTFNTSSTNLLPSIWQNGTGRVSFAHNVATPQTGITLAGGATGTTLQILGNGVGDVYLNTSIAQTGAGPSGLLINQTGTRSFFTGSTIRLGGSSSSFTGGVTLTSGNVMLSNLSAPSGTPPAYAFNGTAAAASTPVNALGTGTLTINGGSVQFDPIAISSGTSPTGITGTLQVNVPVLLNSTLNLTGVAPTTAPSGNIVGIFAGNISGAGGITSAPSNGTLVFGFTGNNTFSGPVNITPVGNTVSTFLLGTGNVSTGNFSGTTSITVSGNSSFTLNNFAGAATRLNTVTAPSLTLNRGNANLFGNSAVSVSETFGALNVTGMGSYSVFPAGAAAPSTQVTFASLNRGSTGTLALTASNMGSGLGTGEGIIAFTANPGGDIGGGGGAGTVTRNILPYAMGNASVINTTSTNSTAGTPIVSTTQTGTTNIGLVRWDSSTGRIAPLNKLNEYAFNAYLAPMLGFPNGGTFNSASNQRFAGLSTNGEAGSSVGNNTALTVNSLFLDNTSSATVPTVGVSMQGSGVVTVTSGAILTANTNATPTNPSLLNLGGINFGNNTGYIHTVSSLRINSPITGTAGVVKSQTGTLILNGNNTFTGGLFLNTGPVQFTTDSNLGASGQSLTLNSGLTTALTLLPDNLFSNSAANSVTVNRPISVGAGGAVLNVAWTNNVLDLPGTISGTGQFFKSGAGVLNLSGTNTYTGNTVASGGIITFNSNASFGAASSNILLGGGTIQPTANNITLARDFLHTGGSVFFTNGNNLTVSGYITSQAASNTLALLKGGAGTLTLTGQNTFLQQLQVGESTPTVRATSPSGAQGGGGVTLSGNGSIASAASIFLFSNAELTLDNSGTVNQNRVGNVTIAFQGGNMTLIGNSSTSINEQVGSLNNNSATSPYGGRLTIVAPTGGGATTLTSTAAYSGPTAANGATLFVRADNLGAVSGDRGVLVLPTNPTATNGLIPSIMVATSSSATGASTFATTTTITNALPNSNQFSLAAFSAYTAGVGALGAGAAANTYDVTGAATFGPGVSASNAMRISAGGSVDLGGGTHTLTAGGIIATGGANGGITNGTLSYGAGVMARFSVATGSDLSVGATITGTTGGLNKIGSGMLTLNGAVTTTTGPIVVTAGTLRLGGTAILPTGVFPFINHGATLDLNNNNTTLSGLNGYGDLILGSGNLTLASTTSPGLPFAGGITGSGALIKNNTNTQILAGNSPSFTGDVRVLGGGLTVNSTGSLGTGTTDLLLGDTAGTTQAILTLGTALPSFNRNITVQAGSVPGTQHTLASAGATTIAINSNINLGQTLRFTGTFSSLASLNGTISGAGGLNFFSGGWTVTGNNTYTGGTTFDSGSNAGYGVGHDNAYGTGALTFTSFGGHFRADGGTRTLANNVVLQDGAAFGVAGTNAVIFNGGFNLSAATATQNFLIQNTATTTINGVISNTTNGITKNGPGVLALTNNNTYTGATNVNSGTLLVNNTSGTGILGAVNVRAGAILGGSGSISGSVTVDNAGILSPGNSPGILTVSAAGAAAVTLNGIFRVELGGATAGNGINNYDQLNMTGGAGTSIALSASSILFAEQINGWTTPFGGFHTIVLNNLGAAPTGNFFLPDGTSLSDGSFFSISNQVYMIKYGLDDTTLTIDTMLGTVTGSPGGSIILVAIPEPGTWALIGLSGIAAVGAIHRYRRRNKFDMEKNLSSVKIS